MVFRVFRGSWLMLPDKTIHEISRTGTNKLSLRRRLLDDSGEFFQVVEEVAIFKSPSFIVRRSQN